MEEIDKIVVLTTVNSEEMGSNIARELVDRRQAACVNIIPSVRSIYRWRGEICEDKELILVIKTQRGNLSAVERIIKEISDYDCPEIIALPVVAGSRDYLEWLDSSMSIDEPE